MSVVRHCLPTLGFVVFHTPGIARAWKYDFPDGSSLLATDLEGFDLPLPNGPFTVVKLSHRDELIEAAPLLLQPKDLYRYLRHMQRQFDWQASQNASSQTSP